MRRGSKGDVTIPSIGGAVSGEKKLHTAVWKDMACGKRTFTCNVERKTDKWEPTKTNEATT